MRFDRSSFSRPCAGNFFSRPCAGSSFISLFALILIATVFAAAPCSAQTLGQYTTAVIAPDGEGGCFISTGKDEFRLGIMARFRMFSKGDLGFQVGFDRLTGENSLGVATDVKIYLLDPDSTFPVDLAADISLGHFQDNALGRTVAGLSLITSGTLAADTKIPIEPYASIGFYSIFFTDREECPPGAVDCDDDNNDMETVLRAGVKLVLTDEYQVLFEVKLDGNTTLGAAINVVF
ncbi:MAG: hypothetical protein KAV42_10700 [Candidatus Krumholzibacteria bacterium]|nr:hypothetical protein [Candidatus Krumholzibacteria bacterium]